MSTRLQALRILVVRTLVHHTHPALAVPRAVGPSRMPTVASTNIQLIEKQLQARKVQFTLTGNHIFG